MIIGPSECYDCRHLRQDSHKVTCAAFPDGIPVEILKSRILHREPFPGDHGIQFEPRLDKPG